MQTSLEPDRRRQVLTDLTGLKQDLQSLATSHQQLDSKLDNAVQASRSQRQLVHRLGAHESKKPLAESSLLGIGCLRLAE